MEAYLRWRCALVDQTIKQQKERRVSALLDTSIKIVESLPKTSPEQTAEKISLLTRNVKQVIEEFPQLESSETKKQATEKTTSIVKALSTVAQDKADVAASALKE